MCMNSVQGHGLKDIRENRLHTGGHLQKYACCAFLIAGKPSDFLCSTFLLCNTFFFTHHTRVSKSNNTKENIRWSAYQLGDDAEG